MSSVMKREGNSVAHLNSPGKGASVRPAAVAGSFYPGDPSTLHDTVAQLLNNVRHPVHPAKAIIAPHAGYIYSGPTAARAYAGLRPVKDTISRVILLGPAHRVYTHGIALSTAACFSTPLGNVAIDIKSQGQIDQFDYVHYHDAAHAQEHSLEVHLPFLQSVIGNFTLVPALVGDSEPTQVANVLEELWGDEHTLIVISSDLSHYHDYGMANRIDSETCDLISGFNFQEIDSKRACGYMPIRGLLLLAKQKNMHVDLLDRCNSGDTAGDRDRVVGYSAFALSETLLSAQAKRYLFQLARKSIESGLTGSGPCKPLPQEYPSELHAKYAVFVTLHLGNTLRGCVGNTEATASLLDAVANSAFAAAFRDSRFESLTQDEYRGISISLSVLSQKSPIHFDNEVDLLVQLNPGEDGLIIEKCGKTATFLPVVWEALPDPKRFVEELKRKAHIGDNEPIERAWRYTVECYSE